MSFVIILIYHIKGNKTVQFVALALLIHVLIEGFNVRNISRFSK